MADRTRGLADSNEPPNRPKQWCRACLNSRGLEKAPPETAPSPPPPLMSNSIVPEELTNNTSVKQWSRRCQLVAGAHREICNTFLTWVEAHNAGEPAVDPIASGIVGAGKPFQHLCASLLMCAEAGAASLSIVDNTPLGNGLEAWRRLVHRFDPASALANLRLMNNILKHPKGRVDNIIFLVDKWEDMVRPQDDRTGRRSLTDETKQATLTDVCPTELERHLMFNSDRFDTCPNLRPAIRDYVQQLRHKGGSMDVCGMAWSEDREEETEWKDARAVGHAKGTSKGKAKGKGKENKGTWQGAGK